MHCTNNLMILLTLLKESFNDMKAEIENLISRLIIENNNRT